MIRRTALLCCLFLLAGCFDHPEVKRGDEFVELGQYRNAERAYLLAVDEAPTAHTPRLRLIRLYVRHFSPENIQLQRATRHYDALLKAGKGSKLSREDHDALTRMLSRRLSLGRLSALSYVPYYAGVDLIDPLFQFARTRFSAEGLSEADFAAWRNALYQCDPDRERIEARIDSLRMHSVPAQVAYDFALFQRSRSDEHAARVMDHYRASFGDLGEKDEVTLAIERLTALKSRDANATAARLVVDKLNSRSREYRERMVQLKDEALVRDALLQQFVELEDNMAGIIEHQIRHAAASTRPSARDLARASICSQDAKVTLGLLGEIDVVPADSIRRYAEDLLVHLQGAYNYPCALGEAIRALAAASDNAQWARLDTTSPSGHSAIKVSWVNYMNMLTDARKSRSIITTGPEIVEGMVAQRESLVALLEAHGYPGIAKTRWQFNPKRLYEQFLIGDVRWISPQEMQVVVISKEHGADHQIVFDLVYGGEDAPYKNRWAHKSVPTVRIPPAG